jgi:hypothetical protein
VNFADLGAGPVPKHFHALHDLRTPRLSSNWWAQA